MKQTHNRKIWKAAAGAVLTLAGLAAAAFLLPKLVSALHPGDAILVETSHSEADLSEKMELFANNTASTALEDLTYIRKIYVIDEDATCGQTPNPACYGSTYDPSEVRAVIDSAAELLDGQEMVWNEDLPFYDQKEISWYLDDTIFVLNWTELRGRIYYCCEVKIAHASQFRRMLADNTYGSAQEYTCTEMAAQSKAVLASNADFYIHRILGINVYNGKLCRHGKYLENCFIDYNGDMLITRQDELLTEEETEQYIKDNNVNFSLAFGPALVENGELTTIPYYNIGELNDQHVRSALGQLGNLHYLIMVTSETTIYDIANKMHEKGCITAYGLDGGQTAETIFNGQQYSHVLFNSERRVSDIIYFATAYPYTEDTP